MIRTKPPSDTYRDGWDRIFGKPERISDPAPPDAPMVTAGPTVSRTHESDCPARIGDPCRCPVGNP